MNGSGAWVVGVAAAALVAAGSGCVSATKELAREESRREALWRSQVAAPPTALAFDWPSALVRLRQHNPKLRSADLEVRRAEEGLSQIKRSLIPTPSLEAGYNRIFGNDTGVSFEPFTFAATVLFDVPGLFNYRTRYEAALLNLTRARLARDTLWRAAVIDLYRAEVERRELRQKEAQMAAAESARRSLAVQVPRAAEDERGRWEAEKTQWSTRQKEWVARTGELLGLTGTPFDLSEQGLPRLPYERPQDRPSPETLARLPLRVAALELVALRARQIGIRLQQLPEIDVSIDSPTIYQTGPGQQTIWSSREVLAGVDAFWTLDTQGRQTSERRLLDAEISYRREVLDQESVAAAGKLRAALDGLASTDRQLASVESALASAPSAWRPGLLESGANLRAARRDWQFALWFFDDAQWASLPT